MPKWWFLLQPMGGVVFLEFVQDRLVELNLELIITLKQFSLKLRIRHMYINLVRVPKWLIVVLKATRNVRKSERKRPTTNPGGTQAQEWRNHESEEHSRTSNGRDWNPTHQPTAKQRPAGPEVPEASSNQYWKPNRSWRSVWERHKSTVETSLGKSTPGATIPETDLANGGISCFGEKEIPKRIVN